MIPENMQQRTIPFMRDYLSNIQLSIHRVTYKSGKINWGRTNWIAPVNRFCYIIDGEGYFNIDGNEFRPTAGHLVLLPYGKKITYRNEPHHPYTRYICDFSATVHEVPLFHIIETTPCVNVSHTAAAAERFRELKLSMDDPGFTSLMRAKSALLDILALYLETNPSVHTTISESLPSDKLNMLMAYIEDHLHEPITVDEMAKQLHYNSSYFHQVFKKATGMTPIQYVIRRKVEHAKQLLSTTDNSISSVADAVGMQFQHFSSVFKQHTGVPPSVYRKHE